MKRICKILIVILTILTLTACNSKVADEPKPLSSEPTIESSEKETNDERSSSKPFVDAQTEEILTLLEKAKQENSDTVAWISIPNTDIDNPVMQTANNTDYMQRNEQGDYDVWGSYFADYYGNLSSVDNLVQNTVIYGHAANDENPDGEKFTQLFRYLDKDFLEENPYIYLTINEEKVAFQIFAVFFTDTDFYYINPSPSKDGFDTFMDTIKEKNEFVFTNNDVTEQDKLLTLSTCSERYDTNKTGDYRFVVMGRLA